jgi:hypothetical protein
VRSYKITLLVGAGLRTAIYDIALTTLLLRAPKVRSYTIMLLVGAGLRTAIYDIALTTLLLRTPQVRSYKNTLNRRCVPTINSKATTL